MNKVEIKNERLKKYLEYELDKNQEEVIYQNELEDIKQITIFGKSISGEKIYDNLSDLLYFHNLKSCVIKDFCIKDEEIEFINKLENIDILHFDNCVFKNKHKKIKTNINKLVLSFCNNINMELFDTVRSIEYLRITSGDKLKLEGIKNLENIKELYLQSIIIKDLSCINKLEKLSFLNLDGAKILKNKKCIDKINANVEYNENNFPI